MMALESKTCPDCNGSGMACATRPVATSAPAITPDEVDCLEYCSCAEGQYWQAIENLVDLLAGESEEETELYAGAPDVEVAQCA